MSQIDFWAEMTVEEGKLDQFLKLARETVDVVKKEPGCRRYSWYFNEEERRCHVHETWVDAAAVLAHFEGPAVTEMLAQIVEIAQITRLELHGEFEDMSPEATSMLTGFGATYFTPIASFIR